MPPDAPRRPSSTRRPGPRSLSARTDELAAQVRRNTAEYSSAVNRVNGAYAAFVKAVAALVSVDRALSRGDLASELVGRRIQGRELVGLALRIGTDLRAKVRSLEVPKMDGSAEEAEAKWLGLLEKVSSAEELLADASRDAEELARLDRKTSSLSLRLLRSSALAGSQALRRFSRRALSRSSAVSSASGEIAARELSNFG